MLDALVFDLDGTLWNCAETSARGWTRACREHGLDREISVGEIESISGLTFDECVAKLFPDVGDQRLRSLWPALEQREREEVEAAGGRLYPGVLEGLEALAGRAPLMVLSNCHRWYLESFLDHTGLRARFADTLCHEDTGLARSENLRRLRERHALRSAVYVGDTAGDRDASRAAGFRFVYAAYGFGELPDEAPFTSFGAVCECLAGLLGAGEPLGG